MAARRREIGEVEAFIPLAADAGAEAEVDWGEPVVLSFSGLPAYLAGDPADLPR